MPLSAISAAVTAAWPEMSCARAVSEQAPVGDDERAHLVAREIGGEARLAELLLGLADRRVFGAALIERHVELAGDRGREQLLSRETL